MDITRRTLTTAGRLAPSIDVSDFQGACVGCSDCTGVCLALIDALMVPDLILSKKAR